MKGSALLTIGIMVACTGWALAGERSHRIAPKPTAESSNEPDLATVSGQTNGDLPEPIPAPKPEILGDPVPAPGVGIPAESAPLTPIPTESAGAPVVQVGAPCAGNCAGGHHGECWQKVKDWACYRPAKTGCCKGCSCCPPPLYMYFLDQCAGCAPPHFAVTNCHPAIATPIVSPTPPPPPAFAPSPK